MDTGALTSVDDVAIKRHLVQGLVNVPNDKKIDLIRSNILTKKQTTTHKIVHVIVIFNWLVNNGRIVDFLDNLMH